MGRPPTARHMQVRPKRSEILDALDATMQRIEALTGRWGDGIPPQARAELHDLGAPLLDLLIRCGRR